MVRGDVHVCLLYKKIIKYNKVITRSPVIIRVIKQC